MLHLYRTLLVWVVLSILVFHEDFEALIKSLGSLPQNKLKVSFQANTLKFNLA